MADALVYNDVEFTVFPFAPLVGIEESLDWLVDVMTAKDGSEQRMAIRIAPRQSFTCKLMLTSETQQARFDALIFGWEKLHWGLPVWIEKIAHVSTIAATDTVIAVDTTYTDFRDGSLAIIWKSADNYEVVKITTVAANSLTLESPVQTTFTGTKCIMPLRIAQIYEVITSRNPKAASSRQVDISFIVKDNILLTGFESDAIYKCLTVLNSPSKFKDKNTDISVDSDSQLQDYQSGDFDYFSDSDFNINLHSFGFVKETKADVWNFRKFLHSLYGQRESFFVLTYREDLIQTETIHAADINFQIENIGLARNMGLNELRTHLAFIFPDGSQIYKQITNITELDSNTELITLDSALGLDVESGDCYISFLDKCRLASDTVTLHHILPNLVECKIPLQDVVDSLDSDFYNYEYIRRDGTNNYYGTGAGFKDEDNMVSDSAVATCSQQSTKAYVDALFAYILASDTGTMIVINNNQLARLEPGVAVDGAPLRCRGTGTIPEFDTLWL